MAASTVRLLAAAAAAAGTVADWAAVDAIITAAISKQVFPGAVLGVLDSKGNTLYAKPYGSQVYAGQTAPVGGSNPAVTVDTTLWDMASCSKIMGATSATAWLYERGMLDLDATAASILGPAYSAQGKGSIRIRDLMMHQAGYPPDPEPGYSTPAFGCPSSSMPSPPLTFSCSEPIYTSLLNQSLSYTPGTQWLYSDLSMITMQYVIGTIVAAQGLVQPSSLRADCAWASPDVTPGLYKTCHFEAFVRTLHSGQDGMGLNSTSFLPPPGVWANAMPTYADPTWRHRINQGDVSDENSYALGGIAGHAGIFTTLLDALRFLGVWHYGAGGGYPELFNSTTRTLFTTAPTPTFSPRALGWLNQVPTDTYLGCGTTWAQSTAYHTGYTGTLLCMDPETGLSMALLTTRVYPNSTGNTDGIHAVRQAVGDAVKVAAAQVQAQVQQ